MTTKKHYTITKTEKLPHSEIKLEGSIDAAYIESFKKKAFEGIQKDVKLDGFRPGHVPEKLLKEKLGEMTVLEEAAIMALESLYGEIVIGEKISTFGQPQVSITKLAPGNPVEFRITVVVMPVITIPDYKKIGKEVSGGDETVVVEEKEINEAIDRLRHNVLHEEEHSHANDDHKAIAADGTPEPHDHKDEDLPVVDESFIKKFGEFKDVEDFRTKVREGITHEKGVRVREKKRLEVMEKILEKSEVDLPQSLVQSEAERMIIQMKGNISQMGLSFGDYLKHINKTEEQMREDFRPDAEKRAKVQLILNKIAAEEKITADEKMIEEETQKIISEIKEADPIRARLYVESMLIQEKVWQLLEGLPKEK